MRLLFDYVVERPALIYISAIDVWSFEKSIQTNYDEIAKETDLCMNVECTLTLTLTIHTGRKLRANKGKLIALI